MKKLKLVNSDAIVLVDDDIFERVKDCVWFVDSVGYPSTWLKFKVSRLHTFVLGKHVDHIDRNKFNNLRSNLRKATSSQNGANVTKRLKNATSQYKGVAWMPSRNKWRARIKFMYESIHLGLFDNEVDAAKAYNKAAKSYFGEYALLNNI